MPVVKSEGRWGREAVGPRSSLVEGRKELSFPRP